MQWRKMTKSSAAVVVVVPAAVSQISTDWSAKITRSHAGHCSAVGSANDNTFQRVSPASRHQDDFANLDTEQGQGFRVLQCKIEKIWLLSIQVLTTTIS